jgi:transglutaminase-like putative cysteine protease
MFRHTILLLNILFVFSIARVEASGPKMEKQPDWVTPTTIQYNSTQLDQDAEEGYVDLDFEKQVSLEHQAIFYKKSIRILSEAGVQNSSEVSVDYDPSYQQLSFHSIRIIRGNQSIDQLNLSKIKTVQQEKELDRFIYNGKLTAVLILEDVRKDDIIEYSYTIKGFNPIFQNKYADFYDAQFSVPVYHMYYKLIVPTSRAVTIKNSQTNINPVTSSTTSGTVYEWNMDNLSALHVQDDLPSWYDPYPTVMVSEFKSWKEVSDWALGLFPSNISLSTGLQKKIEEIKANNSTPETRIGAALRFVQDDIRYMGIEMGVNSHKPHTPSQIFAQRFGDCKDKSYLLCSMLRAMGIEADPVLINTSTKKTINSWLPSPTAFDHCTVRVNYNDQFYWFDPTISYQRGPIKEISYPDYQAGLVVNSANTGLTTISSQEKGKINVNELFRVNNETGPVHLIVTTENTGSYADNARDEFKNTSLYEMKKSYRDFYGAYFDKIKIDSLTYKDDEKTGTFTTIEYYTIDEFWKATDGQQKATFEPYVINSIIKKPKESDRTMPFSLSYPANYHEEIRVNLPDEWDINEANKHFEATPFHFNYNYSSTGKGVVLTYNYENLKDYVAPEEASKFIDQLNQADESIAYTLTRDNKAQVKAINVSSNGKYTMLYTLLGICVLVTYLIRRNNRQSY